MVTADVAKQLSFDEPALAAGPPPSLPAEADGLAAMGLPSVDGFRR